MQKDEALQHALGYAAGREDASNIRTVDSPDAPFRSGFIAFADAYAAGWDRYNREVMHFMTNCRDAYDAWQASNGRSIYRLADATDYTLRQLASDGDVPAAAELAARYDETGNVPSDQCEAPASDYYSGLPEI